MKPIGHLISFLIAGFVSAQAAPPPSLQVVRVDSASVEFRWVDSGQRFYVESSDSLNSAASWQPVGSGDAGAGGTRSLRTRAEGRSRFYRLHEGLLVTRVLSVSPAAGETGVSVKREAVIRLSGPLAADVGVSIANLYAEVAGSRWSTTLPVPPDWTGRK